MVRRLHVPLLQPEDVIPHLAASHHWREGHSAQQLASAWSKATPDFPSKVREALNTASEYIGAELVDGFLEREVELGSRGRNSQTDLMVVAGLQNELAIIAVEGKVEEPFGELVTHWNRTPGRQRRLDLLCALLQLSPSKVGSLRYQLLHRAASAIYEANRYRCRHALVLVHSFSQKHRWFNEFSAFASMLETPLSKPNLCSAAKLFEGVSLRLAWVGDQPCASPEASLATMLK